MVLGFGIFIFGEGISELALGSDTIKLTALDEEGIGGDALFCVTSTLRKETPKANGYGLYGVSYGSSVPSLEDYGRYLDAP